MNEAMNDENLKRYLDVEKALGRIRGNAKLFKVLLKTFLDDTHFDQLKQQIEAGDRIAAAASVHAVKGVSGNLSMTALYELSQTLESQLKSGDDIAEIFEAFKDAYAKTLESVDSVMKDMQ